MGCGSSTTTTTETGQLSARGKSYDSLFQGMLMSNLNELGYDISPTEKTEWKDPDKANTLQGKIDANNTKIAKIQSDIAKSPFKSTNPRNQTDPREVELQQLKNLNSNYEDQMNKIGKITYTDYKIEKKEDPRVQAAMDKYGANAPEVQRVRADIKSQEVEKANALSGIESAFLKNAQKFVNGDMSYTPEQEAQVDKFIAPVKDVILNTTKGLLDKVGSDDTKLRGELDKVSAAIDQTGYNVLDALKAADLQIDQNKSDLLTVLDEVNSSTKARFKFEQDLLFEEVDTRNAQQAALLGLPPGSTLEKLQNAKMKNDVLRRLTLQLNEQEAMGKLNIVGKTGDEKKQISLARVALAESQGGKKEEVAKTGFSLSATTAGKEQDILGAQGNALLALEQNKQSMLSNVAYGGIPAMLQAGSGALGFNLQQQQGQQGLFQSAFAPVQGQLTAEQNTAAQNTKTTNTQNKGFLDTFSDIVGIGAGVASIAAGVPTKAPQAIQLPQFNLGSGSSYPVANPNGFHLAYGG